MRDYPLGDNPTRETGHRFARAASGYFSGMADRVWLVLGWLEYAVLLATLAYFLLWRER